MTSFLTRLAVVSVAVLPLLPSPSQAAGPPVGVYGCYEPHLGARPGLMTFQVAPTVMFGLIDGTTYSDYDGKRGAYTFDNGTGVLTMTNGSRQGWHYKKVGEWSFRMLTPNGQETSYTCPLEPAKDPLKRPW